MKITRPQSDTSTNAVATSPPPAPKGGLGTLNLLAQSLAAGPITSAALLGGVIAAKGGSASALYLVIVMIGVLGLGAIVAMFARRFTHDGVMYEYVGRSLGPTAGITTAGFYYLAYFFLGGPTILIGTGVIGQELCASYLRITVPYWLIALALLLVVAVTNLRGLRLSVHAQLAIFVLSAIPYVLTAIVVIAKGGTSGNTAEVFNPSAPTAGAFLPTFIFCVLLFVGVETSAALGEEAHRPSIAVPRAIFFTIFIVAGFCILTQYAGTIGFGLDHVAATWASDPLGLATLGNTYVGHWISPLLQLGLVLDMVAVAIGFMSAATRGMAALARCGLLPVALARMTRRGTPSVGITVYVLGTVICGAGIVVLCATTGMDPYLGFMIGATFGGLLVVMAYLMMTVAAGKLLITGQCASVGWIAFVVAFVTVGVALVGSIYPMPADATRYGVYGAGVLLVLSLAWGCYHGIVRKHALADAAASPGLLRNSTAV